MSLIHGAIFWNVRSTHHGLLAEQEDINDRLALHYVLGTVAIWPTLMLMITDVWKERDSLERDVKDRLFGRWVHFASKVFNICDHSFSVCFLYVSCQLRGGLAGTNQTKLNGKESHVFDIRGERMDNGILFKLVNMSFFSTNSAEYRALLIDFEE